MPTSGRFSKTVNKGDVNVTVDFTEVTPSNDAARTGGLMVQLTLLK